MKEENNITKDKMDDKATSDFMMYAVAVIKSRAIPMGEDGLKPVNRRVIYQMGEMKIWSNSKTVKSAKVIGSVMGALHPHGDASIYNAMVRLSQPWKMRYPLVSIQGNNGSENGDPAAASRYTEARLSAIGQLMLEGVDPDVVPYVPNFDETLMEPVFLPSKFPNILCNGNEGIAVGMSCGTMPHNLNEVVNLLIALTDKNSLTTEEAMQYLHGPDFPLGGTIINGYKLPEIYKTGRGTIILQADSKIDYLRKRITFTGFPYLVDIMKITKAIKKMVIEDGNIDILDLENNVKEGYLTIVLNKNSNPDMVLQKLYASTPLQKTIKINQTVISNKVPMTLSLLGLCRQYLRHQHNVCINIAKKEKSKQDHIVHMQKGLRLAHLQIDEVIRIIRGSNDKNEAREKLLALLPIDIEQVDTILALKLSSLTRLDANNITIKINKAEKESSYQATIIKDIDVRKNLIKAGLVEMSNKYGDERRTKILTGEREEDKKIFSSMLTLLSNGEIVKTPIEHFTEAFVKDGMLYKKSRLTWICDESNEHFFLNVDGTTSNSYSNNSNPFIFLLDRDKENIVTISQNGIVKRTLMKNYKNVKNLCKVKIGDKIIRAYCMNDNDALLLLLDNGKVNAVEVGKIKKTGKLTIGKRYVTVKIKEAISVETKENYFTVNSKGQVKRGNLKDLLKNSGNVTLNECIQIGACKDNMFYETSTKVIPIDWHNLPLKSKDAVGSKIDSKSVKYVG